MKQEKNAAHSCKNLSHKKIDALIAVLIFFAIIIITNQKVLAQNIGDRAVGMGGAYTALANDTSAAWYNPAGLVHIPGQLVSISANVYQYRSKTYDDFVEFNDGTPDSTSDYKSNAVTFFPSSLIYGMSFGTGLRHSVALSLLVADSEKNSGSVAYSSRPGADYMVTFETLESYRDYYMGPSYAVGTDWLSVGTSLFVRFYDRDYSYKFFEKFIQIPNTNTYILARNFTEQYRNFSFIPSLGAQWNPIAGLHIGLVGTLFSVDMGGTTKINRIITSAGVTRYSIPEDHYQDQVRADIDTILKSPWKLRLGVAYEIDKMLAVEFSMEYSGKIDPYLDRSKKQETLLAGLYPSSEAEHNLLSSEGGLNFNVGMEYNLTETVQIRTGFFTDFSFHRGFDNIKDVVASGDNLVQGGPFYDNNTPAGDYYEDKYGFSLGIGMGPEKQRVSYTLVGSFGTGEAISFYTTPTGTTTNGEQILNETIKIKKLRSWDIAVVVSGALGDL